MPPPDLIPLDEVDEDTLDESPWGRDPFEICALMEEELEAPLKEPVKKFE